MKLESVAVLILISLLAYANSFQSLLSADSLILIGSDERIRAATWENVRLAFTAPYFYTNLGFDVYRPLVTLSYLFNYSVLGNGVNTTGYHVFNFCVHLCNVLLVWGIGRAVLRHNLLALGAAAIFAVHPINVEAVTNLAGRSDLMMALGVLAGLFLHLHFRLTGWKGCLGALLCGLFAVYSKETGVVLFAALLLSDLLLCPAGMRKYSAAYCGAFLSLLALVYSRWYISRLPQEPTQAVDNPLIALDFWGRDFLTARGTAFEVLWRYLKLLFWPGVLSSDYSYGEIPVASVLGAIVSGLALCLLLGFLVSLHRRHPAASFYGIFFFLAIAPVSNVFMRIGTIMGERLAYLPAVGFAGFASILLWWGCGRLARSRQAAAFLLALAVLTGALGWRTWRRNPDWATSATLADSALLSSPNSFKVHLLHVFNMHLTGLTPYNIDQAISSAERARDILQPLPPEMRPTPVASTLGALYRAKGELLESVSPDEARLYYQKALRTLDAAQTADRLNAHRQREADLARGLDAHGIPHRGNSAIYENLMLVHRRLGRMQDAYEAARYLTVLVPDLPKAHHWAAELADRVQRQDDRIVALWKAYALDGAPSSVAYLAAAYEQNGMKACVANGLPDKNCQDVRRHMCLARRELTLALETHKNLRKHEKMRPGLLPAGSCGGQTLHESRLQPEF